MIVPRKQMLDKTRFDEFKDGTDHINQILKGV